MSFQRLRSPHSLSSCWLLLKLGAPRKRGYLTPGVQIHSYIGSAWLRAPAFWGLALPNYLNLSLSLFKDTVILKKRKFAVIFFSCKGNSKLIWKIQAMQEKHKKTKTLVYLGFGIFIQLLYSSLRRGHSCPDISLVVRWPWGGDAWYLWARLIKGLPCDRA